MRKIFIIFALALVLVAMPAWAEEECDANKPGDFSTVPQEGLYGSFRLDFWPGGTTLCGYLVVRKDRTIFYSTGTERLKKDNSVVRGPGQDVKLRLKKIHEGGFVFGPNDIANVSFFIMLSDPNRLSGQVTVPSKAIGYEISARRVGPQTASRP